MTARFVAPLLVTLLLLASGAAAQDMSDMRWGRISDEEKALDAFPDDADANAIVLGDVATAELEYVADDFELQFKRHRRVKVLSEAGYEMGEFSFQYASDGSNIRGVKGQTFVPQPDGSYERVKLDRRSIMDQEVRDGVREIRFSMPALAPGAIFEIEYEYTSESFFSPPTWYFQSGEPTLYSRYTFRQPEFFEFVAYKQGGERVVVGAPKRDRARGNVRAQWEELTRTWTAQNVPALREEPFTTTEEDYTHKVELQLSRIVPPGGVPRQIMGTWEEVAADLETHGDFGRRVLGAKGAVLELARSVTGTDDERARELYNTVREGYVWNGRGGVFADRPLRDVVETKSGSAAELNLLLLALLREAGVAADPVLISTRANGKVYTLYPLVNRFNRVLVLVQPEGAAAQLLDATDPHQPYGTLPVQALSGEGWIATPEASGWISFSAPATTSTTTALIGSLDADGTFTGDMSVRLSGYDAMRLRRKLAEEDAASGASSDEAAEAADAEEGLDLTEVAVEGVDDVEATITMRAKATAPAAEAVGGEMYLTPFIAMKVDENPFKRETREFPVDFAYPFKRTYIATYTLPEGMEPETVPEPLALGIPSGAVTYTRQVGFQNGQLQVHAVLDVAASAVQPEEYSALRDLYDEIVAAEAEALVLTGTPAAAEAPAEPEPSGAAAEAETGTPASTASGEAGADRE